MNVIIEKPSRFNIDTTIAKINEAASSRGWQSPATHNLQQSLAKSGVDVKPVQVLEICKSDYSGEMLKGSNERIVSVLMPYRISVYNKDDGNTYVAFLDLSQFVSNLPQEAALAVKNASDEAFSILDVVVG